MNKNLALSLMMLVFILTSCSKTTSLNPLNGSYTGGYYYRLSATSELIKSPNEVTLQLNETGTYTSSGFSDRKPAGGSGDFKPGKNLVIDFKDDHAWTADFDWNLILNGRFNYETKTDSLILTRYTEPCASCGASRLLYQYRLKRVN